MEFNEYLQIVGENLRKLRFRANLTQEAMEDNELNVRYDTYRKLERAANKDIKLSTLFGISKRLGMEPHELLKVASIYGRKKK